jgi:hypothetical protein
LDNNGFAFNQNFGNTRAGSIAGTVWHDHNADGTRDPEDAMSTEYSGNIAN